MPGFSCIFFFHAPFDTFSITITMDFFFDQPITITMDYTYSPTPTPRVSGLLGL